MPDRERYRRKPAVDISPELAARIQQLTEECKQAAQRLRELSEQRTALFRQLHAQGHSVAALARIAGISHQRMSKVLRPKSKELPKVARDRLDGWL